MWRKAYDDESGVAMITAILAMMAMLSLSVLFVSMTHTENRATGAARSFEAAIHVAEGATDHVIARINRSDEGVYTTGHAYEDSGCQGESGEALERCESQWVTGLAQTAAEAELVRSDLGEGFAVRPTLGGVPTSLILGVGFFPNRADPEKVRVVRLQFDQRSYTPRHAILSCGNFEMGGNAAIKDLSGTDSANVHANGDVTTSGSGGSVSVEGKISGTGTVHLSESVATQGTESGAIEEDCPPIEARDFYTRQDEALTVPWWDLCPDGVARLPDPGGAPCSNNTDSHNTLTDGPHLGWSFDFDRKVWSTNAVQDGVFYVYQGTVKISGIDKSGGASSRVVTIIAEAAESDTVGTSGSSCKSGSVNTGNICLSGNPNLQAALKDTLLVADRDVDLAGSASSGGAVLAGFVFAGEQAEASGTVTITGAVIAADEPHTPRSPIAKSRLTGTLNLQFVPDMEIPLSGLVRVTHWNELRR